VVAIETLNKELDCWSGLQSVRLLGRRCIELNYFPWDSKNFPMFLHGYLNSSNSILERSIKARYLWLDCPPVYRENYLFLYDLGVNGKLTYNKKPTCSWPQPEKTSGLNTQFLLLQIYGRQSN
jgi:hypothetical protein